MEPGKSHGITLKMRRLFRRDIIMLQKGGDTMKEARDNCVEAQKRLMNGEMPNKTANNVHKLGHSAALNEHAEARLKDFFSDEEIRRQLAENNEKLKLEKEDSGWDYNLTFVILTVISLMISIAGLIWSISRSTNRRKTKKERRPRHRRQKTIHL